PPRATLFPYTTLFRSCGERVGRQHDLVPLIDAKSVHRKVQRGSGAVQSYCVSNAHEPGEPFLEPTSMLAGGQPAALEDLADRLRSEEHTSELQSRSDL